MHKCLICLMLFTIILAACAPSQANTPTPAPDAGGETVEEATEEATEEDVVEQPT